MRCMYRWKREGFSPQRLIKKDILLSVRHATGPPSCINVHLKLGGHVLGDSDKLCQDTRPFFPHSHMRGFQ